MNLFHSKSIIFIFFIAVALSLSINVSGQSKIILDKQTAGGYCNGYFDLGDFGFALVFNKTKINGDEPLAKANRNNNIYFYSKDLSKRANFKINTVGEFSIHASKNNLFLIDRQNSKYSIKVLDYSGREVAEKKIDLESVGLNQDLIAKIHFTALAKMIFEVYDGNQELHLYQISLLNYQESGLAEIDIPIPSSDPLMRMNYKAKWNFIGENMGYCVLAQRGSNSEYDASSAAFHLAFYDEDFQLFRELLLDNFLMPNTRIFGKEISLSLNTAMQRFVVSCLTSKNENIGFMVGNYGMNQNSSVLQLYWQKDFDLINNSTYKWVENDGKNVPSSPIISNKGSRVMVSVIKGKPSFEEEVYNQFCVFNADGKNTFNEVQMGNYESLNLDNYCVDNNNMYNRMNGLQMKAILKPYCEMQSCDVIDIDLDSEGNELAIIRNSDPTKNQVIIYRFTKK